MIVKINNKNPIELIIKHNFIYVDNMKSMQLVINPYWETYPNEVIGWVIDYFYGNTLIRLNSTIVTSATVIKIPQLENNVEECIIYLMNILLNKYYKEIYFGNGNLNLDKYTKDYLELFSCKDTVNESVKEIFNNLEFYFLRTLK